jgi:outer membrane protein OmpA-like peptidoglycan-associated protein
MIGAVRAALVFGLLAAGAGVIVQLAHRLQAVHVGAVQAVMTSERSVHPEAGVHPGKRVEAQPSRSVAPPPAGSSVVPEGTAEDAPIRRIPAGLPGIVWNGRNAKVETEPVQFAPGEPDMRPESLKALDSLAAWLKERPDLHVLIVGHTDSSGPDWANDAVSAERAAAVRDYLIRCGVDRRRLASEGRGGREPLQQNDSAAGRQANRRIEFLLMPLK